MVILCVVCYVQPEVDTNNRVAGIPHQFLVRFVRLFDAIRLQLALRLKQRLGGISLPASH